MRPVAFGLAALVLSASVSSGQAPVHAAAAPLESNTPQANFEAFFAAYNELLHAKQYDAIREMTRMQRVPSNNYEARAMVAVMNASALIGLGRTEEAEELINDAKRLAPNSPEPSRILWLSMLVIQRFDFAADAFDRLLSKFPDVVRKLEWDHVRHLLRNQPNGQDRRNADRRIALAQIGFGGDTDRGHYLAENAVDLLVKRGDFRRAADLLPHVKQVDSIENILIQKRFSPLWPHLERLVGANLNDFAEVSLAPAAQRYRKSPGDTEALNDYLRALHNAARFRDAIALLAKLPKTSIEMAGADEDMGWAVNYVALALHRTGRADEADRLFALLNDAPIQNGRRRISMKINRLELLVSDGRFDKALPLLDVTEQSAKTEGNKYAQQVVRRLKYCTLVGVGRRDEAAILLAELMTHTDDAPAATIEALLCAGDLDGAEQLTLATLTNKDWFPERFVRQLQAKPLSSTDPSIWQARWKDLRARPAIARAFDRLGRDMPEALLLTAQ